MMAQNQRLRDQAKTLHELVHELVKRYQFRDRQQLCCYDISVSQCYVLHELMAEPLAMRRLADRLQLQISTVTRIVDQLVRRKYVARRPAAEDRRVVRVALTARGRGLIESIEQQIIDSEQAILERLDPDTRAEVVKFMRYLVAAVDSWQRACCFPPRKQLTPVKK